MTNDQDSTSSPPASPRHPDSDPALFVCATCHAGFTTAAGLNRHFNYHKRHPHDHRLRDVPETYCSRCDRQFSSARALTTHRRRTHPDDYSALQSGCASTASLQWSTEEDRQLLQYAPSVSRTAPPLIQLLPRLQTQFPLRTTAAIKKRLQHLKWQWPYNSKRRFPSTSAPSDSSPASTSSTINKLVSCHTTKQSTLSQAQSTASTPDSDESDATSFALLECLRVTSYVQLAHITNPEIPSCALDSDISYQCSNQYHVSSSYNSNTIGFLSIIIHPSKLYESPFHYPPPNPRRYPLLSADPTRD